MSSSSALPPWEQVPYVVELGLPWAPAPGVSRPKLWGATLSCASMRAPQAMRCSRQSQCPVRTATCRGVLQI